MFNKILIANRGEIAVRIIRACREMRIKTVAVYSTADKDALHVRMADEAHFVGKSPSSESYLRTDKILEVTETTGAEAIHPGYGFLSENPEFVEQVLQAGIKFIGPPPKAMKAMGAKISARRIAIDAGVSVVPGTNKPLESTEEALKVSGEFGFPVMVKASAGGGGKGMRLVGEESALESAIENAKSEAMASFGDDAVYIEKAILNPRHIEIQVFSDTHGNYVHLGERECSIQRRHQKVIEEAPSPINDPDLREKMGQEALKIARAVNYVGAGTVEFLLSEVDMKFYFLEMNTRLQVEHPVTEMVTGIDLVKEQILVAAGERLSFTQEDISLRGHAVECRVYAEDPENEFLPSPGKITRLRVPNGNGVRDDSGVYEGSEVSIYYDPMISKLCTYGRNRAEAIARMRRALSEYEVGGIKTTLPLFREIVNDQEFIAGRINTGFIAAFQKRKQIEEIDETTRDLALIASALAFLKKTNIVHSGGPTQDNKPGRWAMAGRLASHKNKLYKANLSEKTWKNF